MATRSELEAAFAHYQATVRRAYAERDWRLFGELFVEDAEYNEHAYGRMSGRAQIADWAVRTMSAFPGNAMSAFPVSWAMFDDDRGWIVCEIQNVLPDPGDGSVHQSPNLTILHWADGLRFRYEEDVYNPVRFVETVVAWSRVAAEHGRLPDDARPWLAKYARTAV